MKKEREGERHVLGNKTNREDVLDDRTSFLPMGNPSLPTKTLEANGCFGKESSNLLGLLIFN